MDAMTTMLIRGLSLPAGPSCRRCAQPIARADEFGMSERICSFCRGHGRVPEGRR